MSNAAEVLDMLVPRIPRPPALAFVVHGTPEPAGSKRAMPMGRGPGARWGVIDANPKAKGWRGKVEQVAGELMNGRPLLQGPLSLVLRFYVQRPKGHYGKNGVRQSAPSYPMTRPDVLKLARNVEDALTGVCYRDDAQIVLETLSKDYGPERVEVEIREL